MLEELFDVGAEVVAYDDEEDLVERVEELLADDERRIRIAAAGQARTLEEHGYGERMRELSGMLEERLPAQHSNQVESISPSRSR
jgi:spore maturation protein CgeB